MRVDYGIFSLRIFVSLSREFVLTGMPAGGNTKSVPFGQKADKFKHSEPGLLSPVFLPVHPHSHGVVER